MSRNIILIGLVLTVCLSGCATLDEIRDPYIPAGEAIKQYPFPHFQKGSTVLIPADGWFICDEQINWFYMKRDIIPPK